MPEPTPQTAPVVVAPGQGPGAVDAVGGAVGPSPVGVYLARLSESSRRTMYTSVRVCCGVLFGDQQDPWTAPWWTLTYAHAQALRAAVMNTCAVRTANRHLVGFRQVVLECRRLGLMTPDRCSELRDIAAIPGRPAPSGRALSAKELQALVGVCRDDRSARGARDEVIVLMLARCGLRRSELVGVEWDHIDGPDVHVHSAKGKKHRLVHLTTATHRALDRWAPHTTRQGSLLSKIGRSGRVHPPGFTDSGILKVITKRASQAQIQNMSPHDLRRTFITDLLAHDIDLLTVGELAGHASPATTKAYDRRPIEHARRAVRLLHDP